LSTPKSKEESINLSTKKENKILSFVERTKITVEVILGLKNFKDPFKLLGPGIYSYHQLLLRLCIMFWALYLMNWQVIDIYHSYNFYENAGFIVSRSVGNMGFSETKCLSQSIGKSKSTDIICRDGQIENLIDWGFQTIYENQLKCVRTDENKCNRILDNGAFQNYYNTNCAGKTSCHIKDITAFMKPKVGKDFFKDLIQCKDVSTRFFTQFQCKQTQ
jgi:hypothetical protein